MLKFWERERASLQGRWAGLLTLIACFAVALVVADQGSTIDRQRNLIRDLWGDSKQLSVLRMQEITRQRAQAKTPADDKAAAGDDSAEKPQAGKGQKDKPGKKAETPGREEEGKGPAEPNSSPPQHTEWPDGVRVQQAI